MCANCKGSHETRDCTVDENSFICVNCPEGKNSHSALSKECPTYIYQKEICAVMANQNIPFLEAKKQVREPGTSFASKIKSGLKT